MEVLFGCIGSLLSSRQHDFVDKFKFDLYRFIASKGVCVFPYHTVFSVTSFLQLWILNFEIYIVYEFNDENGF